jgi:hypothetical protein
MLVRMSVTSKSKESPTVLMRSEWSFMDTSEYFMFDILKYLGIGLWPKNVSALNRGTDALFKWMS